MTTTKIQAESQDKAASAPVAVKQPETPEKAAGPQRVAQTAEGSAAPPPNGASSPTRNAELLASGSNGAGAAPRAQMMRNLQRSVGNTRVSNLIGREIQTKLSIGAVDDPQEKEADRVAETMAQPGSKSDASVPRQIVMKYSLARLANLRREPKKEETEKQIEEPGAQSSSAARVEGGLAEPHNASPIQRAASTGDNHENAEANIESRITAPSGGQPLPQGLQHKMEAGMGADFSNVRVHDNATDRADAQSLNAKAFTHGSDIWLGPGASANDSKLMAHELTHVVQQQGGATPTLTGQSGMRTATSAVRRFVGSEHAALGNTTGATIDLGDGIVLTWGQVVAIAGDEYRTVEELQNAVSTPDGKARLRAALEHDGVPGSVAAKLPAPTPEQRSSQDTTFILLALENTAHFPDGGQAFSKWAEHHERAIDAALLAGLANDAPGISKAYLLEAFGEHFLTDAFSGGHIRTPRSQIIAWYTTNLAPRVVGPLLANLRTLLVEALVAEANPLMPNTPEYFIRSEATSRVQAGLDTAVAAAGGMTGLTRWVGLGVAGAVSGAIHDAEGETGVLVASDDHPKAWRAFGDKRLADSPESRDQATKAIAAAKADVDAAYKMGENEGVKREAAASEPPARVYFAFNSSEVRGPAARACDDAASYLLYHADSRVELVGHTDPIGSDKDNEALGLRRAQSVEKVILGAGVGPSQVNTRSEGERLLATTAPKDFRLNRRTEFLWQKGAAGADLQEFARGRARTKAKAEFVPPYGKVMRFVPRPIEERGSSGNPPLPDWHWGALSADTRLKVDDWIRKEVGAQLHALISKAPQLDDVVTHGVTLHPRVHARAIATRLLKQPTETLGDLMNEAPGP